MVIKIIQKKYLCLIALTIFIIGVTAVSAADLGLYDTYNIKEDNGKLINQDDQQVGTVKQINTVDQGEKEIYGYDSEAIEKYVSDDPLVKEYIVESSDKSKSGIYWMFGNNGKIYLAFNPTDKMSQPDMLSMMTEFCKDNGIMGKY